MTSSPHPLLDDLEPPQLSHLPSASLPSIHAPIYSPLDGRSPLGAILHTLEGGLQPLIPFFYDMGIYGLYFLGMSQG